MKSAETIFFLQHDISDNQASERETRTHVIIAKYHSQHFFRGIFHEQESLVMNKAHLPFINSSYPLPYQLIVPQAYVGSVFL